MSPNAETILNLVIDADERTAGMMPGWDIELARQKMLFFTAPKAFEKDSHDIYTALDAGVSGFEWSILSLLSILSLSKERNGNPETPLCASARLRLCSVSPSRSPRPWSLITICSAQGCTAVTS